LACFRSNGSDVREVRYPGEFKTVEAYDNLEVTIFQGSEFKVEVTAGAHIIKSITTEVKDNVLTLDNTNKCNFVRGYKRKVRMKVTLPYIIQVSNYGVGPITLSENFKQDYIFIKAENSGDTYINGTYEEIRTSSHGNGDMYFSGFSKRLMIYSYGTNYTRAENLRVSDYIFIATKSLGDAYFTLDGLKTIEYSIFDQGNIYYRGNPMIMRDVSEVAAKGKAIQQD